MKRQIEEGSAPRACEGARPVSRSRLARDPRAPPLRPRPVQPLPRGDQRAGLPAARAPRPGVPPDHGRDLRPAPPGVGHDQRPHPADQRDRLRRHGGGVRQHRPRGRRRRRRRQRAVRPADVRGRRALRRRGRRRRARVGHARRRPADARRPPEPADVRRRARRDLDRRPLRHRRARRRQGRRAAGHRRRHLHRRHRAARRRLGRRRRLRRHPEVPRRRARPGAVHDQRPRLRAPRREAPQLVPRPRPARRLRRRGGQPRAAAGPTTTPHRSRWSSACTPA